MQKKADIRSYRSTSERPAGERRGKLDARAIVESPKLTLTLERRQGNELLCGETFLHLANSVQFLHHSSRTGTSRPTLH